MVDFNKATKRSRLRKVIEKAINENSLENESNTPDFILATYLMGCLKIFDTTINMREVFYGRKKEE